MSPVAINPVVKLAEGEVLALNVEDLTFGYSNIAAPDSAPVLTNVFLNLQKGSRCILVGANGAGELFIILRDRPARSARRTHRCVHCHPTYPVRLHSPRESTFKKSNLAKILTTHKKKLTLWLIGKSTLLQILAGKRLTRSKAKVLGQDVFFSTPVGVTYLGTPVVSSPS